MCGIVGYIGKREAYPILIKGLKRLKYRGYDSAGVAIINDNQLLNVYRPKAKRSCLLLTALSRLPPLSSKNFHPKVTSSVTVPIQRYPFIPFLLSARCISFVR